MRRILLLLATLLASSFPAGASPATPAVEGPDVPAYGALLATVTPFADERFACTESARTATIDVPDVAWDRVVLTFSSRTDGDPWDRLFGVAIGGVEVLRGTTPRAAFTLHKDVTAFASLLPKGQTADVALRMGSWVGALRATVTLDFYDDTSRTAALRPSDASSVVPGFLWRSLEGDGRTLSGERTFPADASASATVELTLSGHGGEEFWYLDSPMPRAFHVLVDGVEIATARAMPYVYALAGLGNSCASGSCGCVSGEDGLGRAVHPVAWWTAQQALDAAGIHTGNGEIPPYRADVDAAGLALLTGARTVEVVQEGGGATWITSLGFLLRSE